MITDGQTNFLYLADTLPSKYPDFFERFQKVLSTCSMDFTLLPGTKDVWAVDYMPIQIEYNRFVQFIYNPSYLQSKKYQKTISNVNAICELIRIGTTKTDIILDGGNLTRCMNKVIMTDRVFADNPHYERKQLVQQLYQLLEIDKLYFIPEQPGDFTGHSDGMVRFIDEHTLVINDYRREKEWFQRAFEIAVHNTGLEYIKIPYNVYENESNHQANGDYINYLQMENTVIIPTFGIKEDDEAIKQLKTIFTGHTVATVDSNEIANEGGVLNCITWNILK